MKSEIKENTENMDYLGDGAYVEYTGYSYILRANHHTDSQCTDSIHLDNHALESLNRFVARMRAKHETRN